MTFDQLVVFLKIMDSGSYRKAADQLFRSQPALTQAIKNLESELGVGLFSRETYRPTLTEAGKIFAKEARKVVACMKALKLMGKELGLGIEAQIRVVLDIICPQLAIMQVIKNTLEKHSPLTELLVCTEVLAGGRERLLQGDVDIAIMPMHTPHPELISEPILSIKKIAVAAPDYFQSDSFASESQLQDYTQIILTDSSKKIEKLSSGVIANSKQWRVTDIHLKKLMILHGMGWGYLPESLVEQEVKQGTLIPIQIHDQKHQDIVISLIKRFDMPLGPISQHIWENLQALTMK